MKKLLFTFITLFVCIYFVRAQPQELSEEDIANFKIRIKEKVEAFQTYITVVADKEEAMVKKDLAIKTALKLFLASATMEMASTSNGQEVKRTLPMKDYFNRLKNLPYRKVNITSQQACYISSIQKTPDNKYVATATIYQLFEGCYSEARCYKDATKKEIDITIEYKEDTFGEMRWVVMLGDVRVTETKKL
jgi:hypothetical protein